MQLDRQRTNSEHARFQEGANAGNAAPSVWIDPMVRPNAVYLTHERKLHEIEKSASVWPTERGNPEHTGSREEEDHRQNEGRRQTRALNPMTPLPKRASAPSTKGITVRPRYTRSLAMTEESDLAGLPTSPQPMAWQYESPQFQAESSLSSLSLVATEAAQVESHEVDLSEINTLPGEPIARSTSSQPLMIAPSYDVTELDTTPPMRLAAASPQVEGAPVQRRATTRNLGLYNEPTMTDALLRPWTTGAGSPAPYARHISSQKKGLAGKKPPKLNVLDQMRWWLLYPGRIEFLLWLYGTIVLVGVTCLLLFISVLSLGWIAPPSSKYAGSASSSHGHSQGGVIGNSCSGLNNKKSCPVTSISSSGLKLIQLTNGHLVPGMLLRIQGWGFSPNGLVRFTHDANTPCVPADLEADQHGELTVDIFLENNWALGNHVILAHDAPSNRSVSLSIVLEAPSTVSSDTGSSGTLPSGSAPTVGSPSAPGGSTPLPAPVGQTPAPATPTVAAAPPRPIPSTVTPVAVTPVPTSAITPTPARIKPTATPGKKSATSQLFILDAPLFSYQNALPFPSWLWLLPLGYILAMTLFGIAGLLYHAQHSSRMKR